MNHFATSSSLIVVEKVRLDGVVPKNHSTRPSNPTVLEKVRLDEIEPKLTMRSDPWIKLCNGLEEGYGCKVAAYPQDAVIIIRRLQRKKLVQGHFKVVERASVKGYWQLRAARGRMYRGDTYVVRLPDDRAKRDQALRILKHGSKRLDGGDCSAKHPVHDLKADLRERWAQEFEAIPKGKRQLFTTDRTTLQTRIRRLEQTGRLPKSEYKTRRGPDNDSAYVVRLSTEHEEKL